MGQFIAKKLFKEYLDNKFGTEDPVFEEVPATRLDGTPTGKTKRVRKALPPGLSENDAKVLTKVKRRAYRLDSGLFDFCGIRVGWDGLIGLVPFVGDAVGFFLSLMVIHAAQQIDGGLPTFLKIRMLFLAALDAGIGAVPFAGDFVDTIFKANNRNAVLLEDYLRAQGKKNLKRKGQPVPDEDPSDPLAYDRERRKRRHRSDHTSEQPRRHEDMSDDSRSPRRPAEARVRDDRGSGRGFFGFGSKRSRPADVEMAHSEVPSRNSSRRA